MGRSLLGELATALSSAGRPRNDSPVPYVSRRSSSLTPGTAVGVRGGDLDAMSSTGVVFAIVEALATSASMVDWHLWRMSASGKDEDRVEVTAHAFLDLLNANPHVPFQELMEVGQQHLELVGEAWLILRTIAKYPVEIWPVRPDRMHPVPHPKKFLTGYVYRGPDGESVPLALDEVEQIRVPNPADPYRGIGPLGSVGIDVSAARLAAQWNHNFFINSAEPGGIIQIPPDVSLTDDEFNEMRQRWAEQHRGVAQAHRVAIIEHGQWVSRTFSMRDMQFSELRGVSREEIRVAWRFPKPLLGTADDVNRAVAEAMDTIFGKWLLTPRLVRWRATLNRILERFPTGHGLYFDFDSPVPEDREADRNDLTAKANAAKALVDSGYDPQEVCAAVGLPIMSSVVRGADGQQAIVGALTDAIRGEFEPLRVILDAGRRDAIELPAGSTPERLAVDLGTGRVLANLETIQADWETALDDALARWEREILPGQYAEAEAMVRDAVEAGDVAALAGITVGSLAASELLAEAMVALAELSAQTAADEATAQGVPDAAPAEIPADMFGATAVAVAGMLAVGVALSAGTEALRLFTPDVDVDDVVAGVRAHLDSLTDAQPRLHLGSALTTAQNAGRAATFERLPEATYYADETNDRNTCGPCGEIHGTAFGTLSAVLKKYPSGKYRDCEGRLRCRGTYVAKWDVT